MEKLFTVVWVPLQSILVTLKITIATLFEVYRGNFRREVGDQRLRYWSARLLELVKLDYQVVNPKQFEFTPGRRYIIMSNHSSYYDIPLIFVSLPGSIRMLAKAELFRVPIWGRGMRVGEFVSINRHDHRRAMEDLQEARKKMESGIILWIAPEGTRSKTNNLLPFKKGGFMLALETGAMIVPVGIRGARDILPSGRWVCQLRKHAEVHIGEPIDAQGYSVETRGELMSEVNQQIRQLVGMEPQGEGK